MDISVGKGENPDVEAARTALHKIEERMRAACRRAGRASDEVLLVGAAKGVSTERLEPYLQLTLENIGENYVQEGITKMKEIDALGAPQSKDAFWHFIGALQSNKAAQAVEHFEFIHSVGSLSLARAIDKAAAQFGKTQDILLQVNLGDEASKSGCSVEDAAELAMAVAVLPHIRLCGLMCLPPYHEDANEMRPYFRRLRMLRDRISKESGLALPHLSMGMSNDFEIAIEEGATMVRVGTALFGPRLRKK